MDTTTATNRPGPLGAPRSLLWLLELGAIALCVFATAGAGGGWRQGLALSLAPVLVAIHFVMDASLVDLRKKLERSSLEARAELLAVHADRLRELATMQGALAHELKNPLASIRGLAGLMELVPERAPERLAVLQKEILRMQEMLEAMLSFSRPLTPLAPEPTNAQTLMISAAELHEGPAAGKQLRLDSSQVLPAELVGDPRKIKQMILNLLGNAIEASARGATIELFAGRQGEKVVLGVHDRGPGVSPELLPRIDQPGVTTKDEAPGLGLTIVRSLAQQHGGSLLLCNRDGGGLSATVELPLRSHA
jgi:two-component system sensor histidine kinase HydH